MTIQDESKRKSQSKSEDDRPTSMGRRAILRGGVTAMPVILTLQSGAALARSSNLIGEALGARDKDTGDVLCLDTTPTHIDQLSSGKFDLGDYGAKVNVIPSDVDYYPAYDGGASGVSVTPDAFCRDGGSRKYKDGGWNYVELPQNGVVVSNMALDSVGARTPILMKYWRDLT